MRKYQIYLVMGGAICIFMLWDMTDYFIGGLGFPRGDWESYTFLLPILLLVVIGLLSREKKKTRSVVGVVRSFSL